MDFAAIALPVTGLLLVTSFGVLVGRDWRWTLAALAVEYVGVFGLVAISWPLEKAAVKLVAGWMAAAVLGATHLGTIHQEPALARPSGGIFRLLAGALVVLFVLSLSPTVLSWLPRADPFQVFGGLLLIGMGLLILSLTGQAMREVLGLLVALSGFEIFYAVVETSALVAGLLALVNLSLALVGTYLVLSSTLGPPEGVS